MSTRRTADDTGYLARMLQGEIARPAVLDLLGSRIESIDLEAGRLVAHYEAGTSFRNPAGGVQGGMLSAMLDDLCASLVDATLSAGQGVATLNLNVSFLRPARPGPLTGDAQLMRRGRDICHVNGRLLQEGNEVASAVAVCKIVQV